MEGMEGRGKGRMKRKAREGRKGNVGEEI